MNDVVQVWKACNFARQFWTFTSQEMVSNVGVLYLFMFGDETHVQYDSCPTDMRPLLCFRLMDVSRRIGEIAFGVPGQEITLVDSDHVY